MISVIIPLFAGLATVLGALLVSKNQFKSSRSFSLAFATGIMLMISLGELLPEAMEELGISFPLVLLVFGSLISLFLDIVLPHHHHDDNHEEPGHYIEECECSHSDSVSTGMIIALVLHNLIEGLANGTTVTSDFRLGLSMAIGIAIHNIPIGSTLAVSMTSAGKKRITAVWYATLVGLSQPLGALIGLLIFGGSMNSGVMAVCNSIVAGILIFISFDELWPAARNEGKRNVSIFALLAGICFIPLTECLFAL